MPQNCPFTSTHAHGMCTPCHMHNNNSEKFDNYEGLILAHEVLIHSGKQRGSHGQSKYVCGVWGWGTMRKKEGGGKKGDTKNPKGGLPHCTPFKKVLFIPGTEGSFFFFISVHSGTIIVSACLLCLGI